MTHHHIMIRGETWCDWTGSQAGLAINAQAGDVQCGHHTRASADRAAKALRPHFRRGAVKVIAGDCPQLS